MERNKEHFYTYAQSSDDESLLGNVHFMDYNFRDSEGYNDKGDDSDDDDDDDDDDDSDDDEEEEFTDNNDPDLSEEDSTSEKINHGYLVDKSNPSLEVNNDAADSNSSLKPTRLNGTIELVNGIDDTVEEKLSNGTVANQDEHNDKLLQDKRLIDLRSQVSQRNNR